ncbi:hypothetical protein ZWY2020_011392 [Hordeum vulgare]|nr:hypothetical protein ZWY2020_011392 [Hordeum vulgare]
MAENHQAVKMPTSSNKELLQAHAELWDLTFSYLKSMALDAPLSFVLAQTNKYHVTAAMHFSDWFTSDEGSASAEMPYKMAHGTDHWEIAARDPKLNQVFNAGMAADAICDELHHQQLWRGVRGLPRLLTSPVGRARRRGKLPGPSHIKCSVLDLPNVINSISSDGLINFIVGDMMSSIPTADAVFLKIHYVCVCCSTCCMTGTMRLCENPNTVQEGDHQTRGKVIIVDMVVGSPSTSMFEGQVLFDMLMMVMTPGKEREEHEWGKIFMDAGFNHYKTRPIMGCMAITELYP